MSLSFKLDDEWLETDGLGGFASGTVGGARTRRYHALLLTATRPPAGRVALVNGFDAVVETAAESFAISSQNYEPGVIHPDGAGRIESFEYHPWPKWVFKLGDSLAIEQEIFIPHGQPAVVIIWRLIDQKASGPIEKSARLKVRPFFSGRDYHSLTHENSCFNFDPERAESTQIWHPYAGLPSISAASNGEYQHDPQWYRNFRYARERERGLDYVEDLAAPGIFNWDLNKEAAVLILAAGNVFKDDLASGKSALDLAAELKTNEQKRRAVFPTGLHLSADAYLAKRGEGKTILAGFPWFTDWGRDTFIAMRGLCMAAARLDEAGSILVEWADHLSEGMLPNRFPDAGEQSEYNSVDASLWFVIAVDDFFISSKKAGLEISPADRKKLSVAIESILLAYAAGTRFKIQMDEDGLLAAGKPGVQLTWMDAKIGDWVVTPRIGKPVEVQALWLNALKIGAEFNPAFTELFEKGIASFSAKFWNDADGCLYDVVDADHERGKTDKSFRPNQIFSVGGLPLSLIDGDRAASIVKAVETRLWTPMGLRSLAPGEPGYCRCYEGDSRARDAVYHQGTVWPYLVGAFIEAWLRVHGNSSDKKEEARERFLAPLLENLSTAGLGHISEIADPEPPFTPRGCPFQAWSVGEALRLQTILGDS